MNECHFVSDGDGFVCTDCGKPSRVKCRRICRTTAREPGTAKPLIERMLTPHGTERLQRCRAANCGMMHATRKNCQGIEGQVVCVGQGSRVKGREAEWLQAWADLLNGEQDCPLWLPISLLSSADSRREPSASESH